MVWQQEHRLSYLNFLDKYRFIILFYITLFFLLSLRLFHLQIIRGKYYRTLSEEQRTQIIVERAPRGIIYDCTGKVIVGNKTSFVALFYPFSQEITPPKQTLDRLGKILTHTNLTTRLVRGWRSGQAVRLAENISRSEMFRLLEQRLMLPGISVVKESLRDYASPDINSHIVGYLSEISKNELRRLAPEGYKMGDWLGRRGLEKVYDSVLRGQDGGWQFEVDAHGHQTQLVRHIPSKLGNSLHTTIDERLQKVAGEALKKSTTKRGAIVALDPRSGAVKILVSIPGYDPNISFKPEFAQFLKDTDLPLFNRAIQALYPPGSVFKIVTFIGAVAEGQVDLERKYLCKGSFAFGNKIFACWEKKGHGKIALVDALAKSCNVYFYQLGLKLGPEILEKYARKFHLGETTGIKFPSEKAGLIPNREWKKEKLNETWLPGDTINMAIGQGPLWITPIQMAALITAVSNRGIFYEPYIVDRITSASGETIYNYHIKKVDEVKLPPDVWDLLHDALKKVVSKGTGRACFFPNLEVAGKTGTAQNPHGDDHSWFVGYAPADNPEIALTVIVENGGSGGGIAAPIARKIFEVMFKDRNIYAKRKINEELDAGVR